MSKVPKSSATAFWQGASLSERGQPRVSSGRHGGSEEWDERKRRGMEDGEAGRKMGGRKTKTGK